MKETVSRLIRPNVSRGVVLLTCVLGVGGLSLTVYALVMVLMTTQGVWGAEVVPYMSIPVLLIFVVSALLSRWSSRPLTTLFVALGWGALVVPGVAYLVYQLLAPYFLNQPLALPYAFGMVTVFVIVSVEVLTALLRDRFFRASNGAYLGLWMGTGMGISYLLAIMAYHPQGKSVNFAFALFGAFVAFLPLALLVSGIGALTVALALKIKLGVRIFVWALFLAFVLMISVYQEGESLSLFWVLMAVVALMSLFLGFEVDRESLEKGLSYCLTRNLLTDEDLQRCLPAGTYQITAGPMGQSTLVKILRHPHVEARNHWKQLCQLAHCASALARKRISLLEAEPFMEEMIQQIRCGEDAE